MSIHKYSYLVRISEEQILSEDGETDDGQVVRKPKTKEWLNKRAEFLTKWKQMEDDGIAAGYLDSEPCYECGGRIIPTTHLEDREWVPA